MGTQDRLRAMVIRNLSPSPKGKGAALILNKVTESVFDPSTGGMTEGVSTDYLGSGLRVNYTQWYYANTTVEKGDFQVYLSPVLLDGTDCPKPQIGDTILFDGEASSIINFENWNSNGIVCGWKLQMRNV